jgi:hypothetical protein
MCRCRRWTWRRSLCAQPRTWTTTRRKESSHWWITPSGGQICRYRSPLNSIQMSLMNSASLGYPAHSDRGPSENRKRRCWSCLYFCFSSYFPVVCFTNRMGSWVFEKFLQHSTAVLKGCPYFVLQKTVTSSTAFILRLLSCSCLEVVSSTT